MIRQWRLNRATRALAQALWHRRTWVDGWDASPHEVAYWDRRIARLQRRVARLGDAVKPEVSP